MAYFWQVGRFKQLTYRLKFHKVIQVITYSLGNQQVAETVTKVAFISSIALAPSIFIINFFLLAILLK